MAFRPTSTATCIGMFKDHRNAQDAVHDLKAHGFIDSEIVMTTRQARISRRRAGAALGVLIGAAIGGMWIAGIELGFITLPAAPWMALGAWARLIIPIVAMAVTGGLMGTVAGWLVRAKDSKPHGPSFNNGATTVSVMYGRRKEEVCTILHRHSASGLSNA